MSRHLLRGTNRPISGGHATPHSIVASISRTQVLRAQLQRERMRGAGHCAFEIALLPLGGWNNCEYVLAVDVSKSPSVEPF